MIEAIKANIVELDAEAIVNAANSFLVKGGGVDGAIHNAAGPQLALALEKYGHCNTGQVVITEGFNLKAKYIIHTVGPIYDGSKQNEIDLANCYQNSLTLAKEYNLHSIGFCCISTGVYGYPLKEASKIALNSVKSWLEKNNYDIKVSFVCYNEKEYEVYKDLLK